MCDLDYFKNINDTYRHVAGDKILKLFVDTAKKQLRNSDVVISYGGEEVGGNMIKTTVSIGLVKVVPESSYKQHFLDEYIMLADQKLYLAKNAGRNKTEMG